MKLTKSKKLVVHFGGVCVEEKSTEELQDEIQEVGLENHLTEMQAERNRMVEELNQSREVEEVSDLYATPPPYYAFNPITFKMHIPMSLQRKSYVAKETLRARSEDFRIAYDGVLLMIGSLCDLNKYPYGAFDARDRLKKVFAQFGEVKTIPPCLSPFTVTFLLRGDKDEFESSMFLQVEKPTNSKELLRELHEMVENDLQSYYEGAFIASELFDTSIKIENAQSRLIRCLREFLKASWSSFWKRRRLVAQAKMEMTQILRLLNEYSMGRIQLTRARETVLRKTKERIQSKTPHVEDWFSARLISNLGESYLYQRDILDVTSAMKLVEHIRGEMDAYSLSSSGLVSAFIGGLVGSIATFALSSLL